MSGSVQWSTERDAELRGNDLTIGLDTILLEFDRRKPEKLPCEANVQHIRSEGDVRAVSAVT